MSTLKDIITGETCRIHICYECDPEQYPEGISHNSEEQVTIARNKCYLLLFHQ
jgi:hypothetical protein